MMVISAHRRLLLGKDDNGTSSTGDDYYQVAVKQTNKWTNWEELQRYFENWQVYAVNKMVRLIGKRQSDGIHCWL